MNAQMSTTVIALPRRTYADIMALRPCYNPAERGLCTPDWTGTALDVLRHPDLSAEDALWLVLREDWVPAPVLHEFACQCAEQALALVENPDPRSVAAVAVKRAWLRGEATDDELTAARDAAWDTTWATAEAAWAAEAAWDASCGAARVAAWDASCGAARVAARNAGVAAWAAYRDKQRADLIALLEATS